MKPFNRRILFKNVEKEEQGQGKFLLPEDMKSPEPYRLVEIISRADDCTSKLKKGDKVIILSHLVEDVKVDGNEYHLANENAIVLTL
jgi:co-chaperonin GroES (HSP10)|tara:strand:- start:1722 stop:1982 length:261 start_codon:yes stop_codon:yes gene_type:complete